MFFILIFEFFWKCLFLFYWTDCDTFPFTPLSVRKNKSPRKITSLMFALCANFDKQLALKRRDDLLLLLLLLSIKIYISVCFTLAKTEIRSIFFNEHDRNCRQIKIKRSLFGTQNRQQLTNDKEKQQQSNKCEPANQLVHNVWQTYKCFN